MHADPSTALRHSLDSAASRRGLFTGFATGMLVADPEGIGAKRKRKQKKRERRKKRKNQKPTTRVDASCSGPASISFKRESGTARFAQTFTAIASGLLIKAELDLVKNTDSDGDYHLRLSPVDGEGFPSNDVLAESVVANADVPVGFRTVSFAFADPPPVAAGQVYALVLTRPGGQLQWDGNLNNPCAGRAFVSEDQTASFTEVDVADSDFIITTFIRS
jgi:hypothetical protein